MSWKRGEIFRLEVPNDSDWELGLLGEGGRLAAVVRSMAKLFTHEAISVVAIVRALSHFFVGPNISSPW